MKRELIEGGLTEKELSSLGETILDTYVEELNDKIQIDFEHRIESIVKDIRISHLSPTVWLVILKNPKAEMGTGIEIDIIIQQYDEDIVQLVQSLENSLGMNVTVMPLEYAEIFGVELKRIIGMIRKVRQHELRAKSKRPEKFKRLNYSDINRVNIDEKFKENEEDDDEDDYNDDDADIDDDDED